MTVVVISSKEQWSKWRSLPQAAGPCQILCDNPQIYLFLKKQGVDFEAIDEFWIRDKWQEINAWGCNKAAEWIRFSRANGYFRTVDWAACFYYRFSFNLIALLKNDCFARRILEKYEPRALVVFDEKNPAEFPRILNNVYLNELLSHHGRARGIAVESIPTHRPKTEFTWQYKEPFFRKNFKKILNGAYAKLVKPKPDTEILVEGSLIHLSGVMEELHRRGKRIALYGREFNFQKMWFAWTHGIPFLTEQCFPNAALLDEADYVRRHAADLRRAAEEASAAKLFVFEGFDLGVFVEKNVFAEPHRTIARISSAANHFENILSACPIRGWLVHEDFSPANCFLAAFFKAKKKTIYCVSHAHYPVFFETDPVNRVHGQSVTFVNSEYEKSIYQSRGWEAGKLVVTGSPRYDRLAHKKKAALRPSSRRFRLLYCASSLWLNDPELPAYLGAHITNYGDVQIPALKELFKAIGQLPIDLVVKPHVDDRDEWQRFLDVEKPANRVILKKSSDNFFDILAESDAMILAHWSTSIVEAAILGVPVILFDLFETLPASAPYIALGYGSLFDRTEHLTQGLQELMAKNKKSPAAAEARDSFEYTFGKNDGNNTARVVDFIQNSLAGFEEKEEKICERTVQSPY